MVLGIASSTYRYLHNVQDSPSIFLISLIPMGGIVWGLFRQHSLGMQAASSDQVSDLFTLIQDRNRIKKICALGGLTQTIAYITLMILGNASIFGIMSQSAFPLFTLSFSAAFYLTARLNELRFKSPLDLTVPNTKFW